MTATRQSAEALALRGLLLRLVEVESALAALRAGENDGNEFVDRVVDLIESPDHRELVQLARAALETPPATPNRNVFYGIVTQYDRSERYRDRVDRLQHPCDGPIIFEQYLNDETAVRANLEERAKRRTGYGWVRIAEIHVEIPEAAPRAIPADQAATHR